MFQRKIFLIFFTTVIINYSICVPLMASSSSQIYQDNVLTSTNVADDSPPLYPSPVINQNDEDFIGTSIETQDVEANLLLGRISTAATCLVAGVEYTHGQQIYRADQCEFCLCLDGEMFCWWQECPPETNVNRPCRDRFPFGVPCNYPVQQEMEKKKKTTTMKKVQTKATSSSPDRNTESSLALEIALEDNRTSRNLTKNAAIMSSVPTPSSTTYLTIASSPNTAERGSEITADTTSNEMHNESSTTFFNFITNNAKADSSSVASTASSTTVKPNVCIYMGVEYKIGDLLPHDTGNCLECICGDGARVSCSPHQCASPEEDEGAPPYRSPGGRPDTDMVF